MMTEIMTPLKFWKMALRPSNIESIIAWLIDWSIILMGKDDTAKMVNRILENR